MGIQPHMQLLNYMSHTPLEDDSILPITDEAGPGSHPKQPLILVISSRSRANSQGSRSPTALRRSSYDFRENLEARLTLLNLNSTQPSSVYIKEKDVPECPQIITSPTPTS